MFTHMTLFDWLIVVTILVFATAVTYMDYSWREKQKKLEEEAAKGHEANK